MTETPFAGKFTADWGRLFNPPPRQMTIRFAEPRPCPRCDKPMTGTDYTGVTVTSTDTWTSVGTTNIDTTMTAKAANARPCGCRLHVDPAAEFKALNDEPPPTPTRGTAP